MGTDNNWKDFLHNKIFKIIFFSLAVHKNSFTRLCNVMYNYHIILNMKNFESSKSLLN